MKKSYGIDVAIIPQIVISLMYIQKVTQSRLFALDHPKEEYSTLILSPDDLLIRSLWKKLCNHLAVIGESHMGEIL